jgi:hypothetical protein
VVDWDGLENRSRCKPTVGSNPTPSAAFVRWGARDSAHPQKVSSSRHGLTPIGLAHVDIFQSRKLVPHLIMAIDFTHVDIHS